MENTGKNFYISTKFTIDNIKAEKTRILKKGGVLLGFDLLSSGKELVTKDYYDTNDFFFGKNGIIINKNTMKGSSTATLTIRHQHEKQRIAFLSNMPDYFEKQIPAKDSVLKYIDYIAEAIGELIPYGLNVDVKKTLLRLNNVFSSKKQREKYRYINLTGLKLSLYFGKAEYYSKTSKKIEKMLLLEVNTENDETREEYNAFIKKLKFDHPYLIEVEGSDYLLGKSLLF